MTEPSLPDTILVHIPARWIAPLLAFQEFAVDWFWNQSRVTPSIHIVPEGEGVVSLYAGSHAVMLRIQDSEAYMHSDVKHPISVELWDGAEEATADEPFLMLDENRVPVEVAKPGWMRPRAMSLILMGLNEPDYRHREGRWLVSPQSDPPESETLVLASGSVNINTFPPFPHREMEYLFEHFEARPTEGFNINPYFVEPLSKFAAGALFECAGPEKAVRVTFPAVPEATVLIMPLVDPPDVEVES